MKYGKKKLAALLAALVCLSGCGGAAQSGSAASSGASQPAQNRVSGAFV